MCEDHAISTSTSGSQNLEAAPSLDPAFDAERADATKPSRKRQRIPQMWKKVKRQSGQQYISARGKVMPGRSYETVSRAAATVVLKATRIYLIAVDAFCTKTFGR